MTLDLTTIDLKVILTGFGILVAVSVALYFQWWRNRKRLSYQILSNVLLISAEEEIQDKVEIRYEGEPVQNVHLLVLKLINEGYLPIKKDDFERPVKFIFPGARILTVEKQKSHPENIGVESDYRDDWLRVEPTLFNRKDYVEFKVLLSDYHKTDVDARIVGVSNIGRTRPLPTTLNIAVPGFLLGIFLSIFLGAVAMSNMILQRIALAVLIVLILFVVVQFRIYRW